MEVLTEALNARERSDGTTGGNPVVLIHSVHSTIHCERNDASRYAAFLNDPDDLQHR